MPAKGFLGMAQNLIKGGRFNDLRMYGILPLRSRKSGSDAFIWLLAACFRLEVRKDFLP